MKNLIAAVMISGFMTLTSQFAMALPVLPTFNQGDCVSAITSSLCTVWVYGSPEASSSAAICEAGLEIQREGRFETYKAARDGVSSSEPTGLDIVSGELADRLKQVIAESGQKSAMDNLKKSMETLLMAAAEHGAVRCPEFKNSIDTIETKINPPEEYKQHLKERFEVNPEIRERE